MIAQGSEELDIVVGVDVDDFERAIRVILRARLSIATITSLLSRKPKRRRPMSSYNVGILGATGAVGQQMLECLQERDFLSLV